MLPTNRNLSPDEAAQVARDFDRYMKENRLSLEAVSKKLGKGFSPSLLSTFRTGKYKGETDRIARAINQFMEDNAVARDSKRPENFVETAVAKRMLTVIRMSMQTRSIGLITGPAGLGKTLTMKSAAVIHPGTIYMRIIQGTRRGPGLLSALAKQLGVPTRSTAAMVQGLIIDHLRGSDRLLLIDEAHQLNVTALEALRDLHDEAGVPIVLCGTEDAQRLVNDTTVFFGQMNSRVSARCDLTHLALHPKPGKPLFTIDEIRQVFESEKLKLSSDGAEFLTELACLPGLGGLRICAKIIDLALGLKRFQRAYDAKSRSYVGPKPQLTAKDLRAICRQMHSEAFLDLSETRSSSLKVKVA